MTKIQLMLVYQQIHILDINMYKGFDIIFKYLGIRRYYIYKMSKRFLRPFFQFFQPYGFGPFVSNISVHTGIKGKKYRPKGYKNIVDANETFDNFFQQYYSTFEDLRKREKQFFEKHYPQRYGKKLDPYQVLEVENNATLQSIKQAYRSKALKYHPKVDSSEEGKRKFNDIARAYHELTSQKKTDDNGEDVSPQSLFEDFHNQIQKFQKEQPQEKENDQGETSKSNQLNQPQKDKANIKSQEKKQEPKADVKSDQKSTQKSQEKSSAQPTSEKGQKENEKQTNKILKGAQLYSESSYYQFINGKRKLHITKLYQKDGKRIKVDRIQGQLPDGSIQVNEILEDGKQVKNRKYIQGSSKKQKSLEN